MSSIVGSVVIAADLDSKLFSSKVKSLGKEVVSSLNEVPKASDKASLSLGKMGNVAERALIAYTSIAGFRKFISFANESTQAFIQLEKGIREVQTLTLGGDNENLSANGFESLKRQVIDLDNRLGILSKDSIPALYEAISAGVPADNAISFLSTAQQAAVAGASNTKVAVDGLTTVMNAYGSEASEASHISDALFATVNFGKVTFEQLAGRLFQVVPTAAALGIEFNDVAAAIAAMTRAGVPARVATTQLRYLMLELSSSSKKAGQTFESLSGTTFQKFIASGKTLQDALLLIKGASQSSGVFLRDMFNSSEAGLAALNLTAANGNFSEAMALIANDAGTAAAAFDHMAETADFKLKQAKARAEETKIALGKDLAPTVVGLANLFSDTLAPAITGVIKAFEPLFKSTSSNISGPFLVLTDVLKGVASVLKNVPFAESGLQLLAFSKIIKQSGIISGLGSFATKLKDVATGQNIYTKQLAQATLMSEQASVRQVAAAARVTAADAALISSKAALAAVQTSSVVGSPAQVAASQAVAAATTEQTAANIRLTASTLTAVAAEEAKIAADLALKNSSGALASVFTKGNIALGVLTIALFAYSKFKSAAAQREQEHKAAIEATNTALKSETGTLDLSLASLKKYTLEKSRLSKDSGKQLVTLSGLGFSLDEVSKSYTDLASIEKRRKTTLDELIDSQVELQAYVSTYDHGQTQLTKAEKATLEANKKRLQITKDQITALRELAKTQGDVEEVAKKELNTFVLQNDILAKNLVAVQSQIGPGKAYETTTAALADGLNKINITLVSGDGLWEQQVSVTDLLTKAQTNLGKTVTTTDGTLLDEADSLKAIKKAADEAISGLKEYDKTLSIMRGGQYAILLLTQDLAESVDALKKGLSDGFQADDFKTLTDVAGNYSKLGAEKLKLATTPEERKRISDELNSSIAKIVKESGAKPADIQKLSDLWTKQLGFSPEVIDSIFTAAGFPVGDHIGTNINRVIEEGLAKENLPSNAGTRAKVLAEAFIGDPSLISDAIKSSGFREEALLAVSDNIEAVLDKIKEARGSGETEPAINAFLINNKNLKTALEVAGIDIAKFDQLSLGAKEVLIKTVVDSASQTAATNNLKSLSALDIQVAVSLPTKTFEEQADLIKFLYKDIANAPDIVKTIFLKSQIDQKTKDTLELLNKAGLASFAEIGAYAAGDVFTRPTFGLIGEAGPEVLIPLTDPRRAMELATKSGLFGVLARASTGTSNQSSPSHSPSASSSGAKASTSTNNSNTWGGSTYNIYSNNPQAVAEEIEHRERMRMTGIRLGR